ncbi:uncharacterized protein PRCAT00005943001 [Priceomyces carsonii]|uniref:uncharacterized protein n=1 Tax=Priceomyces carsonii TaxID=28549 RepID=UPI002ED87D9B|nr:unnamed protein product [Priceomyces carsonii]
MPLSTEEVLPFGDGSNKIFGMENFGNTCYCNSILQCLYYSESFRYHLITHKTTKHEPKLVVNGVKPHSFTTKYEQLLAKKAKEQGKVYPPSATSVSSNNADERPKSSRKGSIFGIKFNSSNSDGNGQSSLGSLNDDNKKNSYLVEAKNCEALGLDQRLRIFKNSDFQDLQVFVTRPITDMANANNRNDYSQSSSLLLNNDSQQQVQLEGSVSSHSSIVIVGIPFPETFLTHPINPFNPSPSSDQRKRSALINGPIINLDTSLQLPSQQSDNSALLYALRDLFESMVENKSTTGVVCPSYFINKLKEKNFLFRPQNMHHDAHEFFNYLINEIIESLNDELGAENNWCNKIFQGLITNETKCLSCETITAMNECFLDLSIDIPPGESSYSLTYSLNNFSKLEILSSQNKFYCNTCSSLQEATKTIKLKRLPEVLVINFKRFKYDEGLDKLVKLFDSISYPFKLRLFNTTDDEKELTLYELYALVIHIGGGPMHGHYVAICKVKSGLWLLFDDETVELVEDSYVMRFFGDGPGLASAYILFYTRNQNPQEPSDVDTVDFGFNPGELYNGEEFCLFQQLEAQRNDSLSSKISTKEVDEDLNSDTASTGTVGSNKDTPEIAKKPALFRKNSRLNGHKEEKPDTKSNPVMKEKDKKTWVGGLKRRETRTDTNEERRGSIGSSGSNSEKRKSIFGFKRK